MRLNTRLQLIGRLREKLKSGGVSVGSWMQIPSPSLAEIMGCAGYDWIAIDMEHGAFSVDQLPDLFRAIQLGDCLPLVRLAEGSMVECKRALDSGAGGVIIPMVKSAEQLRQVRDVCCWPPSGRRGVGFSRANLFGKNFESYKEEAQAPLLIAMIENIEAANNLEEMLKVEGLDAILVGPYDLSASMGVTGDFKNQLFIGVIEQVKSLCIRLKIPFGLHIVSPDIAALKSSIADGSQFIAYGVDGVFMNAACACPNLKEL